tara:strand:- start:559 stop:1077 length:519 start_codon:yes stop_codon:yes gene_type:complete
MEKGTSEIRIYVACLAAYNNGILHGRWIDATQEAEDIWAEIREMLRSSPIEEAEEWAIHDHKGFEGVLVSEYQSIESVCEIAAFISEHGALGGKLIEYYGNLADARDAMKNYYIGCYPYLSDFAQEITEEATDIPENLKPYIAWDRMARDLEINDVLAIETGFEEVHLFWSH